MKPTPSFPVVDDPDCAHRSHYECVACHKKACARCGTELAEASDHWKTVGQKFHFERSAGYRRGQGELVKMADTKIVGGRVGHEDPCETDCGCHVDHKTIRGKGTKDDPFRGFVYADQRSIQGDGTKENPLREYYGCPPFSLSTMTIYARPASEGGNDQTGDGSAIKPYRTFVRAVCDVPEILPPGLRVFINITGIEEVLPADYKLPPWKCGDVIDGYVSSPYFVYNAGVNIEAEPKLWIPMPPAPASDATIVPAARAADVIDPVTKLRTIVLTGVGAGASRASWAGNALKGKFVVAANQIEAAMIYESTPTTLKTNQGASPFTGPIHIMEPSAWLKGTATLGTSNGCLNAFNCDSLAFLGIKITSLNGGFGLSMMGEGIAVTQFCELESATFWMDSQLSSRIGRTWFTGFPSFSGNVFLVAGLMDNVEDMFSDGPLGEVTIRRMVFDTCPPVLEHAMVPGNGNEDLKQIALPVLNVRETLIKNGTSHGLVYNGSVGRLIDVDIYGCKGDGVHATFGQGVLELRNVGTSGAANGSLGVGVGVRVNDGMFVKVDAATTGSPTPLKGVEVNGNMQVGVLPNRTWANFTGVAPINNEFDLVGMNAGATAQSTGSRLYK
jgi:hypothetical protein